MNRLTLITCALAVIMASFSSAVAGTGTCTKKDRACNDFARLAAAEQFDRIIENIDPQAAYSAEARDYIGQAYLMVAGKEGNTPEQEERYCKKALEYGATSAYMGLYFINAEKDTEAALGYLRQYVETKPKDAVPYVILGESELARKNYEHAHRYLVEARKVAHGRSAHLDWLSFQASYLAGDYATASAMLDRSFSQGKTVGDLKALVSADARFSEIGRKSEFRKFFPIVNGASAARPSSRS